MKKKSFQIIFSLFFICFCLFISFFIFAKFRIKKVIVVFPFQEVYGLSVSAYKNILFFNTADFSQYLIKRNPRVKSVTIEKILPNTLRIDLKPRIPKAYVKTSLRTQYIDDDGVLLPVEKESEIKLPVIMVPNTIFFGTEKTDWRLIKAVSILDQMEKASISIDQMVIDEKKSVFILYLNTKSEIIIPQSADPAVTAASLQIIIIRFRIEGKFISKVDFQFDKPIVILSNGENMSSH